MVDYSFEPPGLEIETVLQDSYEEKDGIVKALQKEALVGDLEE